MKYTQNQKLLNNMEKPLEGLLVLEFSQFLAGPSAGLRLADLGARVIKIERPLKGEGGRQISIKNIFVDGNSLLFHTINRNKESYAADLKNAQDLDRVKKLIAQADVMTHNFRPGVMEKIGLDHESVKKINPRIVYGVVSGYGSKGPWANKPGQDLLVQSLSGLTHLSGTRNDGPVPVGLAVADIFCGSHFTQGILAGLIKRGKTNESVLVEVSLLESTLDMQFEVLTTYLNDGGKLPQRGIAKGTAHAYLGAPYGIYQTKNGFIALAMGSIPVLGKLLNCPDLLVYHDVSLAFTKRDEIKEVLANHFLTGTTEQWLSVLEPADVWCADVLSWDRLMEHEGFKVLDMVQEVQMVDGYSYKTTRCPIKIDGEILTSPKASPKLGQDNDVIEEKFLKAPELI